MNENQQTPSYQASFYLDITADVCPMTFVKTKLLIEKMRPGQIAEIRLIGEEPLTNVPRSVVELGHAILANAAEPGGSGAHLLTIEKRPLHGGDI